MTISNYPRVYLYRRVVQAKLFIDEHFDVPINLRKIAEEAYFSKYHFIRLFKSIYGNTPHQYLMMKRVDKARVLLREGHKVTEVCFAVGFESPGSFSALFKSKVGMSPLKYRQKQMERNFKMEKQPLQFIPGCHAMGWKEKNSNFQEVDHE